MTGLMGLITGSGQVNLLSGRFWIRYMMHAREYAGPRRRPAGPCRSRVGGEAGWATLNSA
jgi:hypothetical protein